MEDISSRTRSLLNPSTSTQLPEVPATMSSRSSYLRFLTSQPPIPGGTSIRQKKHFLEDPTVKAKKKIKLDHNSFVTSLSQPVQEAVGRFRVTSEVELERLKKEGYNSASSISKLIDKMKTMDSLDNNIVNNYRREDIDLVMELSGFNEEGAMRALILRDELAKLRVNGFEHPEAIDELSLRMKRMVGGKRKPSLSLSLSPASALQLAKRLKRARDINADDLLATLPPNFSFEGLEPLSPARKRQYEDAEETDYATKRQRLLEALAYETHLSNIEDTEVTFGEGLSLGFAGEEGSSDEGEEESFDDGVGFQLPVPSISFEEFVHGGNSSGDDEEDGEGEHAQEGDDSFVSVEEDLSYSPKSGEEHDETEEQVWSYNPLMGTKKHRREHSGNRTLF